MRERSFADIFLAVGEPKKIQKIYHAEELQQKSYTFPLDAAEHTFFYTPCSYVQTVRTKKLGNRKMTFRLES